MVCFPVVFPIIYLYTFIHIHILTGRVTTKKHVLHERWKYQYPASVAKVQKVDGSYVFVVIDGMHRLVAVWQMIAEQANPAVWFDGAKIPCLVYNNPPRRPRPEVGQEERVTPGHCQREAVCTGPHHVGLQCTAVPHG